ncbi:MAG: hypothetical protein J5509_09200 [Lachnospiraceae bacterium]|nr:hypothetical protein [Lachnospiraceae bacterium]
MKTDNKGTTLCIISLICMFVLPIIFFVVFGGNGDISGATARAHGIQIRLDIISFIAAWVLAIISRATYKNKFSLVLIILYGSLLALSIIGVVVLLLIMLGL